MPFPLTFTQVKPAASAHSIINVRYPTMRMPMFSNNASVYYKPHTLSAGVGSVRNSRFKGKRT